MKISRIFLTENDLNNKITDLKSFKKKRITNLRDLVLEKLKLSNFDCCNKIGDSTLKSTYYFLNMPDMFEGICVEYDESVVDILEFRGDDLLKDNLKNILTCIDQFHKKSNFSECLLLIKDAYAVLVYTQLGDYYRRKEIIDAYRKMFGFKEIKGG